VTVSESVSVCWGMLCDSVCQYVYVRMCLFACERDTNVELFCLSICLSVSVSLVRGCERGHACE